MDKRTIRVLVVDRAGGDYRLIQKSLTQCGVLRYVVERAGNLTQGLEMLSDGRYDCCFVDTGVLSGLEAQPTTAAMSVKQRPIVFVLDGTNVFAPSQSLQALEATRIERSNMTVPHLLMAIRQAVRATAAERSARTAEASRPSFMFPALRPVFPA